MLPGLFTANERSAWRIVDSRESAIRACLAPGWRAGYLSALAGGPFNHDGRKARWQVRYESGRLMVANLRAFGLEPPPWPRPKEVPDSLIDSIAAFYERRGKPLMRRETLL